jgi:hypothetical protein
LPFLAVFLTVKPLKKADVIVVMIVTGCVRFPFDRFLLETEVLLRTDETALANKRLKLQ